MKKAILFLGLAALSLAAPALKAGGSVVAVSFDSFKNLSDPKGHKLDGSVSFKFADQGAKGAGEAISSRINMNKFGKDAEDTCRMALLSAFIKMQERAKRDGKSGFVDVKTYAKAESSDSAAKCVCLAGGARLGTRVEGRYPAGK
jgi:hypothetical protein